jgi:hypothetical protein
MDETRWERLGAVSGFVALALGIAAATFERGAPATGAPAREVASYVARYRTELLAQSLLMLLSVGALLWFLGSLRSFLLRAEGGTGRLSSVAFGAGLVGFGLQAAIQAPKSALAMASDGSLDPQLAAMMADLSSALTVVAYVPVGVMFAAVAVVVLRTGALPAWMGWLSAVTACAHLVMTGSLAVTSGPLARGGWATFVPSTLMIVWLAATTTVMVLRLREPPLPRIPDTAHELLRHTQPRRRWNGH